MLSSSRGDLNPQTLPGNFLQTLPCWGFIVHGNLKVHIPYNRTAIGHRKVPKRGGQKTLGCYSGKADKVLIDASYPMQPINPPGSDLKRIGILLFILQSFPGGGKPWVLCVCVFFFSGRLSALQTRPQAWWQSQGNRSSRGSVDYVRGPFRKIQWSMVCVFSPQDHDYICRRGSLLTLNLYSKSY